MFQRLIRKEPKESELKMAQGPPYLSATPQRPELSQAEVGLRRAPAFTSEVTSGSPVLSSAQMPPWKKKGKAEAGEGHPGH